MKMHSFTARVAAGTVAGMVGITLMVTAGTAGAAKRDVVGDATFICVSDPQPENENLRDACDLLADTQDGNVATFDGKPRDGAQNRKAQSRKAASVVLSLDDVYARGKVPGQVQTAMDDACAYADKSADLLVAGKVKYYKDPGLGKDAEALAVSIYDEFAGGYGDVITKPCA
jgi:hypothetical protein